MIMGMHVAHACSNEHVSSSRMTCVSKRSRAEQHRIARDLHTMLDVVLQNNDLHAACRHTCAHGGWTFTLAQFVHHQSLCSQLNGRAEHLHIRFGCCAFS